MITWKISQLDRTTADGTVTTAHWTCTATEDEFTGSVYGSCGLPAPGENFIDYEDLTEETVLGWIWSHGVDKYTIEAAVEAQIEAQKNPVSASGVPW